MKKFRKEFFILMFALCALLSGCKSMQLFVESVDHNNPPQNFSYPMALYGGKTSEFTYEIVEDKVYLDVSYPAQIDFWLPHRKPEVVEDIDLETRINCACGQYQKLLSNFSATITVKDKNGIELKPYKTEATDWYLAVYFKKDSLPKKITVTYKANFVFDGKEESFEYSATLKRRNMSLLRLQLLNTIYL